MLRARPRRETVLAWLRVVAIHEAYRLCATQRNAHLEDLDHSEGWDALIPARVTIDDTIEARRALRLLAELPERQREDFSLLVAGFTYAEIRDMTGGRTYTNVNKHLAKARARIRRAELHGE
jgi:DNA-directed RNA polymerase specialized sigma24 family protein